MANQISDGKELEGVEYVFVSDMFADQFPGGAELSLSTLVGTCPSKSVSVRCSSLTPEMLDLWKDSKWVFGNISELHPSFIAMLKEQDIEYSFVEFDYKMCKYRNPVLYKFVEGEACEYPNTELGQLIRDFMAGAKSVFFMSKKQRDIYLENFPDLKSANSHILSSIFDDNTLGYIKKLLEKDYEKDKWLVLKSDSWVKGVNNSEKWCKDNNLDYELVGDLDYGSFLKKVRKSKGICFKPDGLDTCPRFIIEAKLLGCDLELNENVQHAGEEWFSLDADQMIGYLASRKDYFWQKAFN